MVGGFIKVKEKPNNFIKRIRNIYQELNKNQKIIADFFLSGDLGVAFLSTREIADKIGCSNASIVRFAQRLGYNGYEEMREEMQNFFQNQMNPHKALKESVETLDGNKDSKVIFNRSVEIDVEALKNINQYIDEEELECALNMIRKAEKIFVFGIGIERSIAEFLSFRLKRFGVDTKLLNRASTEIFNDIFKMNDNSLLFAIGFYRFPEELDIVLKRAKNVNANTILLTDDPVSPYEDRTDLVLASPRGPVGVMHSMVVPMSILNALFIAMGREERFKSALEKLEDMRSEIEKNEL